jgi:hypothetical protein
VPVQACIGIASCTYFNRDLVIIAGGVIHWLHLDTLLVIRLFKDCVFVVSKRNETTHNSSREETIRGISCRMNKDCMGRHASSPRKLLVGLASSVSSSMNGTEY